MIDHFFDGPDSEIEHRFGASVNALSHLSGLPQETAALQLTCALTGVGGPNASVISLAKEVHPASLSMVVSGDSDPRQTRMNELLFSPIRQLQEDLCNISNQISEESLKKLSSAYKTKNSSVHCLPHDIKIAEQETAEDIELHNTIELVENSVDAVTSSGPWQKLEDYRIWKERGDDDTTGLFSPYKYDLRQTAVNHQHARLLRQPLLLFENLPPGIIADQIGKVDRISPLIVDSNGSLIKSAVSRADNSATRIIESLLSGRLFRGDNTETSCILEGGEGVLFSVTSSDVIAGIANSSIASDIYGHSLLSSSCPTSGSPMTDSVETVEAGYDTFRKAVRNIVRFRRRDLLGICLQLKNSDAALFFDRLRQFSSEILEVDEHLRKYASKFVGLPASILWALKMSDQELRLPELIPTSFHLAGYAMHHHLTLIKSAADSENSRLDSHHAEAIIKKLQEIAPCTFRDLVRKFADQKKDTHQPVLERLIETGKVVRLETGQLDLGDQASTASG